MSRPSRDALDRLADVAAQYRRAFDEVQGVLSRLDMGELPRWAFALEGHPLDDLERHSPELARAEMLRRRWRAALHAMAELAALEESDGPPVPATDDAIASIEQASLDDIDRVRLDRFISVLDQARAGGCIYLNGTFQPVEPTPVPAARRFAPPGPSTS